MKRLGLVKYDAHNEMSEGILPQCGNEGVILYGLRSRDVKR